MAVSALGLSGDRSNPLATELLAGIKGACDDHGVPWVWADSEKHESRASAVLAVGFPHHHPQLLERSASAQRALWYGENLPPPTPAGPAGVALRALPSGRILDLMLDSTSLGGRLEPPFVLRDWRGRAGVEREWARNVRELRRAAGAFQRIVVITRDRVDSARQLGLRAHVAPFGYHEQMGGPIVSARTDRDIPIVFLGRDFDLRTRRGILTRSVRSELSSVRSAMVDHGLYGRDRTALLARTRVVIDVHRVPGNSTGLRFVLASAAGAAVVSEPSLDPWPLVPGRHFLEAPVEYLAATARELLADEERRRWLVQEAQELLRGPLAMWTCLQAAVGPLMPAIQAA